MIYLLTGAVFLALIGSVIWLANRAGKKSVEASVNEKAAANAAKANQIDENVARMSDAQLDDILYKDRK